MKPIRIAAPALIPGVILGVTLAVVSGCRSPKTPARNQVQGAHNMWVTEEYRTRAVENAVATDRIVYEHHFVSGTAELNPLGMRDLELLAGYYRERAGSLRVRKGEASDELYATRLDAICAELAVAGIDPDRITADASRYALDIAPVTTGEESS